MAAAAAAESDASKAKGPVRKSKMLKGAVNAAMFATRLAQSPEKVNPLLFLKRKIISMVGI
jgi:hypothetical protein